MEKLSTQKRLSVVRWYLSGLSYDQIHAKSGVSKGAVVGIIADLKAGGFPEVAGLADQVEVLRALSLDLNHSGLAPVQCAVGLAVLNRIKECGLEVADMERWPVILKLAGSEDKAKEFVELVYHIQDCEKKMGLPVEKMEAKFHQLEARAAQLQPALKKVEETKQEIAELEKRRDSLTPEVKGLDQKYATLNPVVEDLQKRQGALLQQINKEEAITAATQAALSTWSKESEKLQKAGFTVETLVAFNDKLRAIAARHHIAISALRDRLLKELENLDKGLGVEALVQARQAELQKQQEAAASAKKECEAINAANTTLTEQKAALEASIGATRQTVSNEIEKIVPKAKETIGEFTSALKHGNDQIAQTVQHIRDQALDVGKEIGRYEAVLEANQWLVELLSLVRGEGVLEAKRLRVILLKVLRGSHVWAKNQPEIALSTIPKTIAVLIAELEGWKA